MTPTSQAGGREKQKRRTRNALLAAAADLARQGKAPTVAEVAEAADISRRTAYRYFPSQEQLLVEVGLEQTRPDIEAAVSRAGRLADRPRARSRYPGKGRSGFGF